MMERETREKYGVRDKKKKKTRGEARRAAEETMHVRTERSTRNCAFFEKR